MDRMKQIMASGHSDRIGNGHMGGSANNGLRQQDPDRRFITTNTGNEYRGDEPFMQSYAREDDPEYVWKRQERQRWSTLAQLGDSSRDPNREDRNWKPPSVRQIWVKLGISAVLFGAIWGMFQIDHPLARQGRQWVRTALTEEYDYSKMAAWYERHFAGLPAILPALGGKTDPAAQKASSTSLGRLYAPVHGKIVDRLTEGELGITLRTEPEAPVAAIDTGRVVAVNANSDKGTVVVIQHASGLQSTYGWLAETPLKIHDWVKGGETIGSVTTDAAGGAGKLYVAVRKDNQYMNPAEVIPFD